MAGMAAVLSRLKPLPQKALRFDMCFFFGMWKRLSLYGMKTLLALYLIKHHFFSDAEHLPVPGARRRGGRRPQGDHQPRWPYAPRPLRTERLLYVADPIHLRRGIP